MQPEFLLFAHSLADAAGEIARRYFNRPLEATQKADTSPVTIADREIEQKLRAMIEAAFPAHGIVGEEFGNIRADATYQWVIDPIDGTRAFIAGKTTFTTLIALCENGVPILGLIDQPITRERWTHASVKKLQNTKPLAQSHIATTSMDYFTPTQKTAFEKLQAATAKTNLGGDAYSYAKLTEGEFDIVVDAGMKPYDYLALAPIITAAGGIITDWNEKPLTLHSDGTVLAAGNAGLHKNTLLLLSP